MRKANYFQFIGLYQNLFFFFFSPLLFAERKKHQKVFVLLFPLIDTTKTRSEIRVGFSGVIQKLSIRDHSSSGTSSRYFLNTVSAHFSIPVLLPFTTKPRKTSISFHPYCQGKPLVVFIHQWGGGVLFAHASYRFTADLLILSSACDSINRARLESKHRHRHSVYRFEGRVQLRESLQCMTTEMNKGAAYQISDGVRTAHVCNRMHQHLCACYKSQTLAAVRLFGHTKILHILILIGMGSAVLVSVVPYPGKATQITRVRRPESSFPQGTKK